jgi:hypothetical protein
MTEDEIRDMETMYREFDAFERMYKSKPVDGGSDLELKNKYWIELGASRAEERILNMLEQRRSDLKSVLAGTPSDKRDGEWSAISHQVRALGDAIAVLKGE